MKVQYGTVYFTVLSSFAADHVTENPANHSAERDRFQVRASQVRQRHNSLSPVSALESPTTPAHRNSHVSTTGSEEFIPADMPCHRTVCLVDLAPAISLPATDLVGIDAG